MRAESPASLALDSPRPSKSARGRLLAVVIGLGLVSVLATTASAAPTFSANASMTPKVQYLNDRTGTVFTFTVVNTGDTRFAAVEIARPSGSWIVRSCPRAPAGWTTQRFGWGCRYRSRAGAADDIPGHSSNANFRIKATVRAGSDDIVGRWRVVVSRTTSFSNRANLRSAPPLSPGLRMVAYSFQVLDAVVVSSPRPIGSACPARTVANHSAITGATGQRIAICGRNRSNGPRTPNAGNSSLGGSFIASHGGFSSGSIRPNSGNVVLANWANVTITSSPGAGKSIAAKIGTRASRTSPLTPLGGYTSINQAPVAAAASASTDEDTASGPIALSASDANGNPMTFSIATGPAHGTLGAISAAACPSTAPAAHTCTATVVYSPAANYNGPDSFTYIATDGFGSASAPATVSLTVNPVNDAPVVNPATFTIPENSPAGTAVGTATASDVDTGQTRTFAIVGGDPSGAFAINASSGAITVANSTPLNYETTPSFSLTVRATDNGSPALSGDAIVTVNLTDANDAPTVTTTGGQNTYTENGAAIAIDSGLTVADVDHTHIESAVVRISAGFQPGDILVFTDNLDLTGDYDPATGVLTVSGNDSLSGYQASLRLVTFQSTHDNPATSRIVAFKVNDGSLDSAEATKGITITPVNDAPIVTTTAGSTAYTENGAAVTIDGGLTVADPDDTMLPSAKVRVTDFVSGDFLSFTNQLGINGVYNLGTGELTLTGAASLADYQTALRSVRYATSSQDPSSGKTIGFTVNDGDVDSAEATKTIAITAVNDAPGVLTTAGNLAVTEGDAATAIDTGLTVTDPDDTHIESGQVRISAGFQAGDTLSFVDNLDITGSYNPGTGVLTLTGNDSLAGWQASLRTVAYSTTNDHPAVPKTVEFKVNDGNVDSNAATKGIDVTVVNDASTVTTTSTNLAYTEDEGAKVVDAGVTVTDPDSVELTSATVAITTGCAPAEDVLALSSPPAGITVDPYNSATCLLTLHGSATTSLSSFQSALPLVTYSNNSQDPSGSKTVSIQVRDDFNTPSNVATRAIDLTAVNDAPTLNDVTDPAAILEDAGEQNEPLSGISAGGGESQTLTVTAISSNTGLIPNPTVTYTSPNATGLLAYAPVGEASGSAIITVTVMDDGGTANGGVETLSRTFTVTVSAVNDAPVITAPASVPAQFETATPLNGISLADVDAGSNDVSFTLAVNDGTLNLDLTVAGGLGVLDVTANGTDTILVSASIEEINATLGATNGLRYTSNADFAGTTDTLDLVVDDLGNTGSGGPLNDSAEITITFNEPPVADDQTVSTDEDTAVTVTLTATDAEADPLTWIVVTLPTDGTLYNGTTTGDPQITTVPSTLTADRVTYLPALNSVISRSFTVKANDSNSDSNVATITINVNAINDEPVVTSSAGTLGYTENAPATAIDGLLTVSDVDDTHLELGSVNIGICDPGQDELGFVDQNGITGVFTSITCSLTLSGTATVADYQTALRSVTYHNSSDDPDTTQRTATFTVNDGDASGSDTRGIDITAVNDAPVVDTTAGSLSYTENDAATAIDGGLSVTDADDVNLEDATIQVTTGCTSAEDVLALMSPPAGITVDPYVPATCLLTLNGSASVADYQAALRAVTYANSSDDPSVDPRTVTFTADDGSLDDSDTRGITVTAVNDAPIVADKAHALTGNVGISVPDGSGLLFGVTDPEGNDFTAAVNPASTHLGDAVINANGSYTFNPKPGRQGLDTVGFEVCDGGTPSACSTADLDLTVADMIWFVDNDAAPGGDGRISSPFNTLGDLATINNGVDTASSFHPAASDTIFIYRNSATDYTGGVTLLASQKLVGAGATASLSTISGITPAADSVAVLPPTGGTRPNVLGGLVLGSGNTVRGVTLGNAAPATALGGSSFGTLTLASGGSADVEISTDGRAISLATGTVAGDLISVTSTGGANNVLLTTVASTGTSLGSGALSGATGDSFAISGGGGSFSYSGSIIGTTGNSADIASKTGGTVTLTGAINDTGAGIRLASNTGATIAFSGGVTVSSGVNPAFTATGGGTVSVTGATNTLATTTGTALNVANTTIGSSGLTFRSVSADGAANGIVLTSTGSSGGLTVTGTGTASSGGTIQNISGSGNGVALTDTRDVSLSWMNIQNTGGSGISGTGVTNFSFVNGTVNSSGDGGSESNIAFNASPTGNNIAGTLAITGSTLTNAYYSGVDIQSGAGTVSNATISNNVITSSALVADSQGFGISIVGIGSASTSFNLTKATIASNTITNFPSAAGIQVSVSNTDATGPGATAGVPGSGTDIISITGNTIHGSSALVPMGTHGVAVVNGGGNSGSRTRTNFTASLNDILNTAGTAFLIGNNGYSTMTGDVTNNTIVANHAPNFLGANGIGGGNGVVGAGVAWTPDLTLTVTGNTISATDGNGILLVGRGTSGTARFKIQTNTVAAPINDGGSARQGIRVDAGNSAAGSDDTVCVNISGNTSAGTNAALGIGLRKQGTAVGTHDFGINGLSPSPATGAQAATHVAGLNPLGGGVDIVSGDNFVSCVLP